jgi:hypothetical protein
MSLCKIDYIVDLSSLMLKQVPKNYYIISIYYKDNIYYYKKYEDDEDIDENSKFYRYQDLGRFPEYYFTIKLYDKTLNFKVLKLGIWYPSTYLSLK